MSVVSKGVSKVIFVQNVEAIWFKTRTIFLMYQKQSTLTCIMFSVHEKDIVTKEHLPQMNTFIFTIDQIDLYLNTRVIKR